MANIGFGDFDLIPGFTFNYGAKGSRGPNTNTAKDFADSILAGVTGNQPTWQIQQNIDASKAAAQNTQNAMDTINAAKQNNNQLSNTTTYDANGSRIGGGGGGGGWSAADLANYQLGVDQVNHQLGRLPGQLEAARGNINDAFNQGIRSADTGLANARNQLTQGQTKNQQNYRTSQNETNAMAAGDRNSLLRMLASMGAGGGSEAQYLIPELVGQQAAKGLAGAAQNFAGNEQNLNTAFNTYKDENDRYRDSLSNQRDQQLREAESQSEVNKTNLLNQLMNLNSQKAAAMGGNVRAAVQPYLDQVNSIGANIDSLARFTPRYTGQLADYVAPSLESFAPSQSGLNQQQVMQNAQTATTPYLQMLLGQRERRDNMPLAIDPRRLRDESLL